MNGILLVEIVQKIYFTLSNFKMFACCLTIRKGAKLYLENVIKAHFLTAEGRPGIFSLIFSNAKIFLHFL